MKFLKMHGLGNDFVILDRREDPALLDTDTIKNICHRNLGVGCDQLIVLEPSENADFFMRIYNPDASESGACGNAARCVADLYMHQQGADACTLETAAGVLPARKIEGGLIEVDMGAPRFGWQQIPLSRDVEDTDHLQLSHGGVSDAVALSMGNPHCVFFVPNLANINLPDTGHHFEHHKMFPQRTNVEFVQILSRTSVRLRTWERGAGLTMACGSAACATVVAGVRRGLTERKIEIMMDGGILHLEWRESDDHVLMTGPVAYVFEGTLLDD